EPPELRPRLEPELVREAAPRLPERVERIRLPAASVEGEHQLPPQTLAERVVDERRAQRRDELPILAEGESALELLLERVDAQPLEPARLGVEQRRPGQALQRLPAPEGDRRRDRVRRGGDVTVPERRARLREQLLELNRVHTRLAERVTVGRPSDRAFAERRAQARDVVVEGVPRRCRKVLAPEAVHERVDVDDAAAAQREQREQGLPLRAADVCRRPLRQNLERAE